MIQSFLNPEGHQNPISGSKVTAILLKGWIWPIGEASAGEGDCACSLRNRLVLINIVNFQHCLVLNCISFGKHALIELRLCITLHFTTKLHRYSTLHSSSQHYRHFRIMNCTVEQSRGENLAHGNSYSATFYL